MRFLAICVFLLRGVSQAAALAAAPNHVTVLLQFDGEPSRTSISALNAELRHIVLASHLPLQVTVRTTPLDGVVSGDLIIFRMKGSCTMDPMPVAALSDERGPLAMTHLVNGEILPFGEVECDRVRHSVQESLGRGNPREHESQYGTALARVMAHEMYHMLSKSSTHQLSGLTKRALSPQELSNGTMLMSGAARAALDSKDDSTKTSPGLR